MFAEPDDEPASQMITTVDKQQYDINNLPGKVKVRLVMEGDISVSDLISPANMPGKKLKEMRDRQSAAIEEGIKKIAGNSENPFKKGDLIKYRNFVTEIEDIDDKKIKIHKREGGTAIWVHHTKVEPIED